MDNYRTKEPMVLYYRSGLEVIASLFKNPVFAHHLEMTPYKLSDDGGNRVFGEFMSAEFAWDYQVCNQSTLTTMYTKGSYRQSSGNALENKAVLCLA